MLQLLNIQIAPLEIYKPKKHLWRSPGLEYPVAEKGQRGKGNWPL
jgi:hypothetical protein